MFEVSLWTCGLSHKEVFPLFFTALCGGRSGLDRRSVFTATRPVGPATVAGCRRHAEKKRHATQEYITPVTSRHRALRHITRYTRHTALALHVTQRITPRHATLSYPHHRTHETTSLHCVASRHITSLYTVYNVMRRHTVLYHSILHYVTLYYITQHWFTLYCITSGNTSLLHTIS